MKKLISFVLVIIMALSMVAAMAEGDIPAYQSFLNADSSVNSEQYDAARKALQVIIDTVYGEDNEVADNEISDDIPAYQKFLNADSAVNSVQYDAGKKALQVIKDTVSNENSDIYGMIGRQEFKEAVKFLIDPEIEINSSEWNAKIKQLERWFKSGSKGIMNFWDDLQSNGFIDSNGHLSGTVEDEAKALETNYDVIIMMLDQMNQYLSEPIIFTQE